MNQDPEHHTMQIRRGKADAIEGLYNAYAPRMLSLCLRYMGNQQDAEDILHDGFMKVIRSIDTFRDGPGSSLEAWIRRIMVNTALNAIRSRTRQRNIPEGAASEENTDTTYQDDDGSWELLQETPREKIMEMICSLPEGYRTVFNLYVFEDYSHQEIATLLNITGSTSKSQLSKARAMLRKQINEWIVQKHDLV